MKNLILQPTTTAHWHTLIQDAQTSRAMTLSEDLESYLVHLLMRFTDRTQFAHSVLAIDFLEGDKFKEVGDKCLLLSGLFPKRAQGKNVGEQYFVNLGQCAYEQTAFEGIPLYQSLSEEFLALMHVLRATRHIDEEVDLAWLDIN